MLSIASTSLLQISNSSWWERCLLFPLQRHTSLWAHAHVWAKKLINPFSMIGLKSWAQSRSNSSSFLPMMNCFSLCVTNTPCCCSNYSPPSSKIHNAPPINATLFLNQLPLMVPKQVNPCCLHLFCHDKCRAIIIQTWTPQSSNVDVFSIWGLQSHCFLDQPCRCCCVCYTYNFVIWNQSKHLHFEFL